MIIYVANNIDTLSANTKSPGNSRSLNSVIELYI